MAEAAVSFLVDQLSASLRDELHLLGGLEEEIIYFRDEMSQMKEFLRVAGSNTAEWIGQLREIAYDIEVILDKYRLLCRQHVDASGCSGCIKEVYASIKNVKAHHQIASQVQATKNRLQNISAIRQRYMDGGHSSRSTAPNNERGGDVPFLDEDDVVGIKEPKEKLLRWIHQMDDGLQVISVVGMGGLGKTTLVKKVYDDESIKKQFEQHIWIVASDNRDNKHMLANLIKKLVDKIKESPPEDLKDMSVDEMREFIFKFLKGKRYIIVLDDVWHISAWEAIRSALPNRGSHGCVVMTTRFDTIANAACSERDHVHELKPLREQESRELFYKKAFPRSPCPDYVKGFVERILKRCEGLPLAISVIGGLLATKEYPVEEWEMFERNLGHELESGGSLELLGESLISLCYNDLPYYLKDCYLYLSIFPRDGLMEKEKIIQLWIAEGLVQPRGDKTMEEVAVDYLNHLFSRSLILVAERNIDGRPRAFRIHELLRDYIISKSKEQNLVTIHNGGEMLWPSKIRRLAIQKPCVFPREMSNLESVRSLVLSSENMEPGAINEIIGRCRLLKVLDLRGAALETIPNEVFKLYYLKYLSLRGTMIKVIPKSIKYLENLETLDLKNCNVTELPIEILKLRKLRHLIVYRYKCFSIISFDNIQSCKTPCNIGMSFPHLLKLCAIEATEADGIKTVIEIGKLTQLRRLSITKLRSQDGKDLCSSISKLTNLRSIRIDSIEACEKLDLDYQVSLPFLRLLQLNGYLERVPEWIRSLDGLTTLILSWSRLREDPLDKLQDLPNLASLWIHGAEVEGLRFKAQGFGKLKELGLAELTCLRWVRVEKGSMPLLKDWQIRDCKLLEEAPQGIEHLTNLQGLYSRNKAEGLHALTSRLAHSALQLAD